MDVHRVSILASLLLLDRIEDNVDGERNINEIKSKLFVVRLILERKILLIAHFSHYKLTIVEFQCNYDRQ